MTTSTHSDTAHGAHQALLFYMYVMLSEPEKVAAHVRLLAEKHRLLGRVIIAHEGINATLEGALKDTEEFLADFMVDDLFAAVQVKRSKSRGDSFPKLSVKVRDEIVGTGFTREEADPLRRTATYISPEVLRSWYAEERDFVVVDMRNNYEFASGHFANAVEPGISASRHLPLAMEKLEPLKQKTVVTVCTGGIRCEKMSAYLLNKGFSDVYQLEGGIHSYMEKYPGKDFQGTLYTFDQRQTMHFGGKREVIGQCHLCTEKTESYADCGNDTCHLHFLACEKCRDPQGNVYCSHACTQFAIDASKFIDA